MVGILCPHFRAAGTLYMVQKLLYVISISEGEIRSIKDKKRSITDENDLSLCETLI